MSTTKQQGPISTMVGILIAAVMWVLVVLYLVSYFGFKPEDSIEDVIGTKSPFLLALVTIPNALLVVFGGIAIGKAIRRMFKKSPE